MSAVIKLRSWEKPAPVWLCWEPDQGGTEEDAHEVEAYDAEQAAEDYAEWSDINSADYTILRGSGATICVRGREPGAPVERYVVTGETVPEYTARPA